MKHRKNALLGGHSRSSLGVSIKDEILAMQFSMDLPGNGVYPLAEESHTYPDYDPWRETELSKEKLTNPNYLKKGYFDSPLVSNEYYLARNLVQETLLANSENCASVLGELVRHFTASYNCRNEEINKIRAHSNTFRIPPKVTLTALKREAWLRDLANPDVPLLAVSQKVPHGIRGKTLIESMCHMNVPLSRAIWFTRVCLYGELLVLRKKHLKNEVEALWLQEWTQHVADHLLKKARAMPAVSLPEQKDTYTAGLNYVMLYIQALYVECLVDRLCFLAALLGFLKVFRPESVVGIEADEEALAQLCARSKPNYGQLLVGLTVIRMFWKDILKEDHLCKALSEALLLTYYLVEKVLDLPEQLRGNLVQLIADYVICLFKQNTNAFIVPSYWKLIGEVLVRVLASDEDLESDAAKSRLQETVELLNFRNESLMLNMKFNGQIKECAVSRLNEDPLKLVESLDKLRLNNNLVTLLKPKPDPAWRERVHVVVGWCALAYRNASRTKILVVCNFLKKIFQGLGSAQPKAEFETAILDSIFSLGYAPQANLCMHNLYVLINELYQLKIIAISTYLRKVIASGVFYLETHDAQKTFHLGILQNLPVLNNKQSDHILKKWTHEGFDFAKLFERGTSLLQREIIDPLLGNACPPFSPENEAFLASLNVGLKFLLANWLTFNIKQAISSSAKLIHVTPAMICKMFSFYAMSDNYTVFFKVLVKFILKNENRVIIYYLDSLYLMARLIVDNFVLVKTVAGLAQDATSAQELFKLVVTAYKDLLTRETDMFRFVDIWRFIDKCTETRADRPGITEQFTRILQHNDFDSPLRVHDAKNPDSFIADLRYFLECGETVLSDEEVEELARDVGESDVEKLLALISRDHSEGEEFSIYKLLENARRTNPVLFADHVKNYVGHETPLPVLQKLICADFLSMKDAVALSNDQTKLKLICWPATGLHDYQQVIFDINQRDYRSKHLKDCFLTVVRFMVTNTLFEENEEAVLLVVRDTLIADTKFAIQVLRDEIGHDLHLCSRLLPVDTADLAQTITIGNEFNLPIMQCLFEFRFNDVPRQLGQILLSLPNLETNHFFGELFSYLKWDHKYAVFQYLERSFLAETEFQTLGVSLNLGTTNLLPYLVDFFEKFSVSSSRNIGISPETVDSLFLFCTKLSETLNGDSIQERSVTQALYICLRLLVLHESLLVKVIAEQNRMDFLETMVGILNSKFLKTGHEKLHILLYDLLVLVKSSLTQLVSADEFERKDEGGTRLKVVSSILNLAEPNSPAPYAAHEDDCVLMLDEDELHNDGDVATLNKAGLVLLAKHMDGSPFDVETKPFSIQTFRLIEDASSGLNSGCLNLSMFETYATRENPP